MPQIVAAVRQGGGGPPPHLPAAAAQLLTAVRAGFAGGIDDMLQVTAAVAFAGALGSLLLIRRRDFVARPPAGPAPPPQPAAGAGEPVRRP